LVRKFFFGGITDDGSKSSSMKASLENGNIRAQQNLLTYSSQYKKLDMQHLSMMPGHGLFSLYWVLQSSNHVAPGVIFL
jgi:hypothetical protein